MTVPVPSDQARLRADSVSTMDTTVKDDENSGAQPPCSHEAFRQVLQAVAPLEAESVSRLAAAS